MSKSSGEPPVLSHVHLGTNDFEPAFRFYSALFTELGLKLRVRDPDKPWAIWQPQVGGRPLFIVGAPYDGAPASAGNGQMVALLASSRAVVDRCHAAALAHGGACEGPPALRPHYHPTITGLMSAILMATSSASVAIRRSEKALSQPCWAFSPAKTFAKVPFSAA